MLRTFYRSFVNMNSQLKISHMRIPYRKSDDTFDIIDISQKDPLLLFKTWFEEAVQCGHVYEPNAMALATCSKECIPSVRFVLLKELDENGFHFFTNYESRKAQELDSNPNASLLFYWNFSNVRCVEEYFKSRSKASQISATVSQQSQVVPNREFLDKKYTELENEYADKDKLPKPSNWGGYILFPKSIEFWQGQTNRLHDRIRFRRSDQLQIKVIMVGYVND
ncbi:unnamed protein product [Heterobilharzia americana]|nr:unnamed protein product [Heterobilharzia americana]